MSDLIERAADIANDSRNLDHESEVICEMIDEIERLTASIESKDKIIRSQRVAYFQKVADNEELNESVKKFIAADAECERLTADLFEANLRAKTYEEGYDEMVAARDYFKADNERLRVVYDAAQALAETWGVKPRANAIELVQFMDNLDDALAAVEDKT